MDTPKKLGRPCATSMGDDVASLGFGDESFDANESFTTEEEAMSAAGSGAGWAHPGHPQPFGRWWDLRDPSIFSPVFLSLRKRGKRGKRKLALQNR